MRSRRGGGGGRERDLRSDSAYAVCVVLVRRGLDRQLASHVRTCTCCKELSNLQPSRVNESVRAADRSGSFKIVEKVSFSFSFERTDSIRSLSDRQSSIVNAYDSSFDRVQMKIHAEARCKEARYEGGREGDEGVGVVGSEWVAD